MFPLLFLFGWAASACSTTRPPHFADAPPLSSDPDRHLFGPMPRESYSSVISDGFDKIALRPVAHALKFAPEGEARNINTLDEVPDSSWFTNRLGQFSLSAEEVAAGPCQLPPLDGQGRLEVTRAKPDGASPGFVVRAVDGKRYLLKFDTEAQGPRASAADAIVSRLFYAAGYTTPCNRVLFFDRAEIGVGEGAIQTDGLGHKSPMSEDDLDAQLSSLPRLPDGRFRALASLWLDGRSIGPWSFEGTRADDPNDVVPHEDRRELRGLRLLAAWVGHKDQREQNTLDSFIEAEAGRGWVRHALIDFGDCFGHFAPPVGLARRLSGHAYGFDVGQITTDLFTFGAIVRPFERERFGAVGPVLGYFNVERFNAGTWKPLYPNPAFERLTERDGAWMARILASFTREHVARTVRSGRLGDPAVARALEEVLWGRRERLLRHYLGLRSPLAYPSIEAGGDGAPRLCVRDLVVRADLGASGARYEARFRGSGGPWHVVPVSVSGQQVCVPAPRFPSSPQRSIDWMVEFRSRHDGWPEHGPLEVHLYFQPIQEMGHHVVGVVRPSAKEVQPSSALP